MFEVAIRAGNAQEVQGKVDKLAQVVLGWWMETRW
jgi:hypothetical protein